MNRSDESSVYESVTLTAWATARALWRTSSSRSPKAKQHATFTTHFSFPKSRNTVSGIDNASAKFSNRGRQIALTQDHVGYGGTVRSDAGIGKPRIARA